MTTTGVEGEWAATNPQGLLYLNGKVIQGLDINHHVVPVEPGKTYEIMIYFYVGTSADGVTGVGSVDLKMDITVFNLPICELYYDMSVPFDAAKCFPAKDYVHIKTIKHLEHACNLIDFREIYSDAYYESIAEARKYLKEEYYEKECGASDAVVSCIGHTHIDVAWLWTLAQTREKTVRSFSTVLNLMKRYPEYIFMSSQPQLYQYLKEEEPALYEEIKQRVKEGRWEVEGAMWLEADCNLSSGESLIRQILHGKQFMMDEFGVESHILWLPDVFGYSAALPQILTKSGIDQFVTSKISWNQTNMMPYDSFMWEGVDGTEIFTYFLTAQPHDQNTAYATYIGEITPTMVLGTWNRYQQKEYNNETIITYGYGDGGGGPTEKMLEMQRRLSYGLPGIPKTQMSRVGDFLARVEENFHKNCEFTRRTPKWVGELYLEFHRATYTSIAKNKRNNRKSEFLCQGIETMAVIDKLLCGGEYPKEKLHKAWRTILLNQFHDIIPGSSIREVYEDSDREYKELFETMSAVENEILGAIAKNTTSAGWFVYNPNSFPVSDYVESEGKLIYAENIPALGFKVVKEEKTLSEIKLFERGMESEHYKILFDENMNMVSVFDKDNQREVVEAGKAFNQLRTYEDYPLVHDNWEMADYHKQKMWEVSDVSGVETIKGNGYGGYRITRKLQNSMIIQTILIYAESRRIDVKNEIDWHEHHLFLKAIFPMSVHATKANYEIQFGNIERPNHSNTSWDAEKFEVCAQKWGDLSEEDYGVSILNDCKYGYGAVGNEMTLTLIKCGTDPNPEADQGEHIFTYSIYPHKDNARRGGTIKEAYQLNRPLVATKTNGGGTLSDSFSLITCANENIVIETIKQAEDGEDLIVRLYDTWDKKTDVKLCLGFEAESVMLCDLMENVLETIGNGNKVTVPVGNFEIVTLRIKQK